MEAVINKYQYGKIYIIRSPHTDKYYIGSTIEKYLSSRFNGHNNNYKLFSKDMYHNITSFEIIKLGNAYIELLELFPCNSKLELHKREGELIRDHMEHCINKVIPGRDMKTYKIDNKESIKQQGKEYRERNKESINQQRKEYRERNKEKINNKKKEYYEQNKKKKKEL